MFGFFRDKTVRPDEILRLVTELNSVFDELQRAILPGITTREVDRIGEESIRRRGYEPMFRSRDFDGCVSVSIGEQVLGTLPSEQVVTEGDLLSLNVGIRGNGLQIYRGWTFLVRGRTPQRSSLLHSSHQAMCNAIDTVRPGNKIRDVSEAIEKTLFEAGYMTCREYQGHAIGKKPYADPPLPCFVSRGKEMKWLLEEGQVFCLAVIAFGSGWQTSPGPLGVVTADGSESVHLSHIVAVTSAGCRVLTSEPKLILS